MKHTFYAKMLHLVTIVLPVYLHLANGYTGNEWGYKGKKGPGHWHVHFPHCAGLRQSPVRIQTAKATGNCDWLVPFEMKGYDSPGKAQMDLENNGYTVQVNLRDEQISITGGGLKDVYIAEQFHFHWGKTDDRGSEHVIDGKYFPMERFHTIVMDALQADAGRGMFESLQYRPNGRTTYMPLFLMMHIVHYSKMYKNFIKAVDKENGLAVLAFLFEIGKHNIHFDRIINHFSKIAHRNDRTKIETFALRELLPQKLDGYYRYYGSLTTPPCYESVIWSIFFETIEISEYQLKSFRQSVYQNFPNETSRDISDDYRPLQRLNKRIMYSCKIHDG